MRSLAVTVIALTFCGVVFGGGVAPASDPLPPPRPPTANLTGATTASIGTVVSAWREAAVAATGDRPSFVHPTHDLDDDGIGDLVTRETHTDNHTRIVCRSGASGRAIASVPLAASTTSMPVESDWHTVLVATTTVTPMPPGEDVHLVLTWIERCSVRWTKTFTGHVSGPEGLLSTDLPYLRGTAPGRGRRNVLVETRSHTHNANPLFVDHVVHVLDGTDGEALFTSDPVRFVDESAQADPLPDLTRDGIGDYAFSVMPLTRIDATNSTDRLDAYHATSGEALWTVPLELAFSRSVGEIGDLTGDRVPDVLINGHDADKLTVTAVDGAGGGVIWTKDGEGPTNLAPAGAPALIRLHRLRYVAGSAWLEVAAVEASGSERYRQRILVGPSGDWVGDSMSTHVAGDVDDDRTLDAIYHATVFYEDESERSVHVLVSGRTGAVRTADVTALLPAGAHPGTASFDGRGDDVWSHGASQVLRDGATGRVLARWLLPERAIRIYGFGRDTDRCRDLIALTGDGSTPSRLVAISGATGQVAWAVPELPAAQRRALDSATPNCRTSSPRPPPTVSRPPNRIPATGTAPAWAAVVASVTAAIALRIRRRAVAPSARRTSAT